MRSFISERKTANGEEVGIKVINSYIEIEYPINKDIAGVLNIIPRSESSAWVAACYNHYFDELVSSLDKDTFETVADTWPILAKLLYNGVNERYQDGALIMLEDSDYCEKKWFVASIAGNISFDSPEDLFGERMQEVAQLVLFTSAKLAIELDENKPNMLREFGKGFLRGLGFAALVAFLGGDSGQGSGV